MIEGCVSVPSSTFADACFRNIERSNDLLAFTYNKQLFVVCERLIELLGQIRGLASRLCQALSRSHALFHGFQRVFE
jgi:hypothetical protein